MFGLKSKSKGQIFATQNGQAFPLTEVPDQAFSEKMLGDGIAILPTDNIVLSPVDGTIIDVTDTLHAYCIQTNDNLDVLVHIGVDTVTLKGEGFKSFVKVGDKVKIGDKLAEADINFIKEKGYEIYTPIIITNMADIKDISIETGDVKAGQSCVINYSK